MLKESDIAGYMHRTAISNERIRAINTDQVAFTVRTNDNGGKRLERLPGEEFVRRFMLHVLPGGFHRIRHYRLIANNARKKNLARARELLQVAPVGASAGTSVDDSTPQSNDGVRTTFVCSHCGAPMVIVQTLMRQLAIRAPPQSQEAS